MGIYTRRKKKAGHLNIKTKMTSEYSQRAGFVSQPIRTRASKLFLCKGGLPFLRRLYFFSHILW